jgi:hypothetical protein
MKSFRFTNNIIMRSLRNPKSKNGGIDTILINNHSSNNYNNIPNTWFLDIVEIHKNRVDVFARMGLLRVWFYVFFTFLTTSRFLLLLPRCYGSVEDTFTISWVLLIFRVTTKASTNFASSWWQFSISDILWDLAETGFVGFWEGFHTFSTTTISGLEFEVVYGIFVTFVFFLTWFVLGVLSATYEVLFGTTVATAGLAALLADLGAALAFWDYADTGFFWCVGMFA